MSAAGGAAAARHAVVLFYRYADISDPGADAVVVSQRALCERLGLHGRVLVADEGINGTLSSPDPAAVDAYIAAVEASGLFACGKAGGDDDDVSKRMGGGAGNGTAVDWKRSASHVEPFPDIVVKRVAHLVAGATGTTDNGGVHLSPEEFHAAIAQSAGGGGGGAGAKGSDDAGTVAKELVLVDVRNTFECAIGGFAAPDGTLADHPNMKSFAEWQAWVDATADRLKGKKVLMYCTGGIRCEKASVMLRERGVDDVAQLRGGIHRYLDAFPDGGFFRGKNFVFDKRRAMAPAEPRAAGGVVGRCGGCGDPFDELHGGRVCTVCRDLVLACPRCRPAELHCAQHAHLKRCFFTFIDHFSEAELREQASGLGCVLDGMGPGTSRNRRRTVARQLAKVEARADALVQGDAFPAPFVRRCRSCGLPSEQCDGLCWGFWKESRRGSGKDDGDGGEGADGDAEGDNGDGARVRPPPRAPVNVGDRVRRGPAWAPRYADQDGGAGELGTVVEVKGWGAAGARDAVAVRWDAGGGVFVYRFGVVAVNGTRVYDVVTVGEGGGCGDGGAGDGDDRAGDGDTGGGVGFGGGGGR